MPPSVEQFNKLFAAKTGLDPRVVAAWTEAEGGPADNPLNIGPGKHFSDPVGATVDFITSGDKNGYYKSILANRNDPAATIAAIKSSPWDAGHYSNGVLDRTASANGIQGLSASRAAAQSSSTPAPSRTLAGAQSVYGSLPEGSSGLTPQQNMAAILLHAAATGGQIDPSNFLSQLMAQRQAATAGPVGSNGTMQSSAPNVVQVQQQSNDTAIAQHTGSLPVAFSGVTTKGIKQSLLDNISKAAASIGATQIKLTSGYRSATDNTRVGGATDSNHLTGNAVDGEAFIPNQGWVPLGKALLPVAGKFGLRSGSTFDWNGSPDIWHVDDAANQH